MNVSSEAVAYPINHHRHILNGTHPSIYNNVSPSTTNNKIRANTTRKSRITLHSYYDFTDIRPLNIPNVSNPTNSSPNFSNLAAEKLLERSKDIRLGRISALQNTRPSVLSSTSTANQQSIVWPNYPSPNGTNKHHHTNNTSTVSSATLVFPTNKCSVVNMPDIHQRLNRTQTNIGHTLIEGQNSPTIIETRHRSLNKAKSPAPKVYYQRTQKNKSPFPISQIFNKNYSKQSKPYAYDNVINLCESEDDQENIPMVDEEYDEYVRKAITKCADWLLKYVIDKDFDENGE